MRTRDDVSYDVNLAERVREALSVYPDVREQAMFGGLGFLLGGRMLVAASRQGGLMVRVPTEETGRLLTTTAAQPMEMKGRAVRGWLHIDGRQLRTARLLEEWIVVGVRSLGETRRGITGPAQGGAVPPTRSGS